MPLLRAFEVGSPLENLRLAIVWGTGSGVAVGLAAVAMLSAAHLPGSAASLAVRLGSALFAAITLESVLHLAFMSGVVGATGQRRLGIAVATVAYVLFHMATLGGQPPSAFPDASLQPLRANSNV